MNSGGKYVDDVAGMPTPARYWAVVALAIGVSLSVIDGFIVNIALPTIAADFGVTASESVLIVSAYQLVVTMALLPLAALGDKIGYRRVYNGGFALFILASLWCAMATSLESLVAARALQGLGGAGVMCVGTALTRSIYPARFLGRGLGINAMVVAGSAAAGPTIGGLILAVSSWHWLFLINLPIGIAGLLLGLKVLPWNKPITAPFDVRSAVLSVLTFGFILLFVDGVGHGQAWTHLLPVGVLALVVATVFIRRQLALPAPMLPVDLLREPLFFLSMLTAVTSFCAQMLAFVSLPFFLSLRLGMDAVTIGMLFTAWPLTVMVMALVAGRLADHYSAGLLGTIGLAIGTLGLFLLSGLSAQSTSVDVIWRMAICGAGFGLFQTPNTRFIVGSAPKSRAGSVSGMIGTLRVSGQTVGASLAALMLNMFDQQAQPNLELAAGLSLVAALFSITRTSNRFRAKAHLNP